MLLTYVIMLIVGNTIRMYISHT